MDFRILGPLEVADGEHLLEIGGARQRALLGMLVLFRGAVVSTERLIDGVYGARPPVTAAKSLQAHVSRVRKALPPDRLLTRANGYVLEADASEVDAERFTILLDQGRSALRHGDALTAERQLSEALALWRGRAFGDLAYEEFAQGEVARLEDLRLLCVEELVEARLALGQHADVIGELELRVSESPLRERLRGQLMTALYRAGRQADALEAYRDARRVLLDELGIEPSRSLQALERSILIQDASLEAPPQRVGARPSPRAPLSASDGTRRATGVFVGRERELTVLDGVLADVRRSRGGLVLVSGEAGIGKSRLVDEFTARARAEGVRVLWGRCWEAGGAPAYWPWVQALRSYVREADPPALREQLGDAAPEVAQLLPELRELFPDVTRPGELDSDAARFRLFDATAAFVVRAAAERPLVLVMDDVHVADTPSLLLLEFVCAAIHDAPLGIVALWRDEAATRDEAVSTTLGTLVRQASTHIVLRGLDDVEVASFIAQSHEVEADASLVHVIRGDTEGNPLFVGEVVRLLAAEGRLADPVSAGWHPSIPATVKEVIGQRVGALGSSTGQLLELAAVIGREFGLDLLSRLAGKAPSSLVAVLDDAVAARVVTDVPGATGRLRFTHALVRDTLYDALPQARRIELHRAAAEAIVSLGGASDASRLSELAHHLFLALPAVDPADAVEAAERAGANAQAVLAHEEAVRLYQQALEALELVAAPGDDVECRILVALGDATMAAGDAPAAQDAYLRAISIARQRGLAELLAEAALGYGGLTLWSRTDEDPLTVSLLEEALDAQNDKSTAIRARLLARLAGSLRHEHDPARRGALSAQAVDLARRLGDDRILALVLDGRSAATLLRDNSEERLQLADELTALARRVGDRQREFSGHVYAIVALLELGALSLAAERHARATQIAEELHQPAQDWLAHCVQALLHLYAASIADAEASATAALRAGERSQRVDAQSAWCAQLFAIRREQGRLREVEVEVERAAARYRARPVFRCMLAVVRLETGQLPQARRLFEELAADEFAGVPTDMEWLLAMSLLTEICVSLADRTRAATLHRLLLPYADRVAVDLPEGCAGSVSRSLGLLAALLGDDERAEAHLRKAIEDNRAFRAVPWEAHARIDLAGVLRRRGQDAAAAAELVAARAIGDANALAAVRDRADRIDGTA